MDAVGFENWLKSLKKRNNPSKRHLKDSSVTTYLNDSKRVEDEDGFDLDNEFAKNEMESLLERYTYTTADEESDKPNPTHLVFKSKSLRKSLSDHKTALNHYRKFHLGIRP